MVVIQANLDAENSDVDTSTCNDGSSDDSVNCDQNFGVSAQNRTSPPLIFDGAPLADSLDWYPPPSRLYSRRELLADFVINFAGVVLGCVGGIALLIHSRALGDVALKQFGFLVYSIGIVTMFVCSAACHHYAWDWKRARIFSSMDYMGISAMIAGSYTPPMLQSSCYRTLAFVWALAILGTLLDIYKVAKGNSKGDLAVSGTYRCVLVTRFLLMGWSCAVVFPAMHRCLPDQWMYLTVAGGIVYTMGLPIFLSTFEFHNAAWHFMILLAAVCMYLADFLYIAGGPPPGEAVTRAWV